MLALGLRLGERIIIGDPRKPIGTIKVVRRQGSIVVIGFHFPKEISVNREPIADQLALHGRAFIDRKVKP